ncbi:Citrate/oxoglutarate carrier protein [Colletotrichum spinosum]|uniref:Citrate/oxoglutarate carrier protein n=1 Tax=Colletotrichum spinosum TaxID=1347390 RepID=A0A4R8Q7H6_9PEZI|nr:Citrate/oxoglutarate carrier protein [Colletotrichum spinosum]
MATAAAFYAPEAKTPQKRKTPWRNLAVGACMNVIQVTSLGQPMEVIKTHASANRNDTLGDAVRKTWGRAGFGGFYQGLIPWAWIEASTKGAILVLTSTEVEYYAKRSGLGSGAAGVLGGVVGGASQAYLTMGEGHHRHHSLEFLLTRPEGVTTCMKTVEVTRQKGLGTAGKTPGTVEVFLQILREKGIRGVNRGVNAVALRQITGWSSRIGISRVAEGQIRSFRGKSSTDKLAPGEKIVASIVGGALSCWNQPFEVVRVEMQSLKPDPTRPQQLTMASTARHIYATNGVAGFFRGVVPRIGVASWATVCMVGFGDILKEAVGSEA